MENWGLVTYRERLLLVDPENTSEISKQYVALVAGKSMNGNQVNLRQRIRDIEIVRIEWHSLDRHL